MEGKKLLTTLPDHLVERIIAMIPFPAIFRARCLSKSWRARFSSIASQDDEGMKRIASSFQGLLRAKSKNWETFCPVFIGTNGDLVAFDKKTYNWRKLPSVSFLPEDLRTTNFDLQIDEALLCGSTFRCHSGEFDAGEIYVVNILTRTWKQLPLPPAVGCKVYSSKLVVTDRSSPGSSETSKVILLCQGDLYEYDFLFVQIYDSKPGSWSCMKLELKSACDQAISGVQCGIFGWSFLHNNSEGGPPASQESIRLQLSNGFFQGVEVVPAVSRPRE